ncbi:MAG TPA: response regulator transcription factor [Calditrichia bacterium]|nr:response regulator transcription factor [Calditrichota bacterium]HQU73245.1 response regulator transcription factor [Calditrichia bacterium]HQV33358.1 response regulator transcription factor [Calditrichia bacterium]
MTTEEMPIYVGLVEDDPDIRNALRLLVDGTPGLRCIGDYPSAEKALSCLPDLAPDVILLDLQLPGSSGIEALPTFLEKIPETVVLMLTVHEEDHHIFKALEAGAKGYLLKTTSPEKLLRAIREVYRGGSPMTGRVARRVLSRLTRPAGEDPGLTRREKEILGLLCRGHSYKLIAATLHISAGTVHCHVKNIYRKLDVHSSNEAVARAFRENLI